MLKVAFLGGKKEKKMCLSGTQAMFLHLDNWQLTGQVEHVG